jgi:uncharacterized caspase-like protein
MKRLILIFAAIMIAISAGARTYVLVVGESNYNDEQNNLAYFVKGAKNFYSLMKSKYPDTSILTSQYANKSNIFEKLNAICNRAQSGDRIVFYYAGHGMTGYLSLPASEKIYYTELIDKFNGSNAGEVICFIDACHSGSVYDAVKSRKEANNFNGRQVYFVGSRAQEVSTASNWVGQGFFTQAVLKGLRGKADDDKDKIITISELFKFVFNDVTGRTKSEQHPQLIAPKEIDDLELMKW